MVSRGEADWLAGFGEWGDGEGGGGEVPGVQGAEGVFADERERLLFDLVLGCGEDGDGAVGCEVSVEEGEESSGVASAGAGGADKGSRDLDPCPGAGDGRRLGVVQ